MTQPRWRQALKPAMNAAGFLIGLAGVVFVVLRLRDYAAQIDLSRVSSVAIAALGGLAVVSGLANVLLGLAWWRLLLLVGLDVAPRWAIRAHGVSQIGRYVPGNIFQFAGRQAIGVAAGLPGGPLARSVLWELGLLASVGAVYALLAAPLLLPAMPGWLVVPGLLGAFALARRLVGPPLAQALLCHVGLVTLNGSVFVAILGLVQQPPFDWSFAPTAGGAFVLAWLLGLVTPGAPAGGGVREAALLFLLGRSYAQADLLLAIVLGRMVNVVGDFAFFALASGLRKTEPHATA
jgi:hypothetical protein